MTVMPVVVPTWAWIGLAVVLLGMVAVDLIGHRRDRVDSRRRAITWSAAWVAVAVAFGAAVSWMFGRGAGEQYFAAYLLEKSLSVDNLFVFVVVFGALGIPAAQQRRVLTWGILTAFATRGVFIFVGMSVFSRWHAAVWILGILLIFTGIKLLRKPDRSAVPRLLPWLERHLPWTRRTHGNKFFVRLVGKWTATPLFVALIAIELVDIVFAADSLPGAFAITEEPFLIYSSNLFALLGLRSLYVVLGEAIAELRYLHVGLAVVLAFAGAKMLAGDWIVIPPLVSVGVIALVIATAALASVITARRARRDGSPRARARLREAK